MDELRKNENLGIAGSTTDGQPLVYQHHHPHHFLDRYGGNATTFTHADCVL